MRRNEKFPVIRTMVEDNPDLSQKKIAQGLPLHRDIVRRLITEELNWRPVNFRWIPHILTTSQKSERVKISRKLFGQLNKSQVNGLVHVIAGDETWAYLVNPKSAIRVGTDVIRQLAPCSLPRKEIHVVSVFQPHRNCRYHHVTARRNV
jgi:hypothetical protein